MSETTKPDMAYSIGEVAKLARVSIRALHHYDAIGLLSPSGRSAAGYRLYVDADLRRLQQVLFHRELGLSLDAIKTALDTPADRLTTLEAQRRALVTKLATLQAMLVLVDATIDHLRRGDDMSANDLFRDFDPSQHDDEVRARWGDTYAYAESRRRTKDYTADDWARMRGESDAINQAFVALLVAGVPADDPRAAEVAERHRQHIDRWFYPCSTAMHRGLAEMYLADPRFTATYEKVHEGLALYVHDAISGSSGPA